MPAYRSIFQEDHPSLTMQLLRSYGFGQKPLPFRFTYEHHGIEFVITCTAQGTVLAYHNGPSGPRIQVIQTRVAKLARGDRTYLECPHTLERASALYLIQGQFVSAQAYGLVSVRRMGKSGSRWVAGIDALTDRLLGENGKPKARGENRGRLAEKLIRTPLARQLEPEVENLIYQAERTQERKYRSPLRSTRRDGPYSTAAAIAAGGFKPPLTGRWRRLYMENPMSEVGDFAFEVDTLPRRQLKVLEDTPALDIRVLADLAGPDGEFVEKLVWPQQVAEAPAWHLVILNLSTPAPFLKVRTKHGLIMQDQNITLAPSHPSAPRRYFMVCPLSGTRCDILYLRDGFFASAKAQRLKHRSQF